METFTVLGAMVVIAYAFGSVGYQLLRESPRQWHSVLPFSLTGVILGEALWASYLPAGPTVLGVHPLMLLFAVPLAITADQLHRNMGIGATLRALRKPAEQVARVRVARRRRRAEKPGPLPAE